jgi:glycosyltransferase involved in cell wall biosynthesis
LPSVWQEPFGLVVLEGLACGCLPLVAGSGALPEAAGPVGRVFARGDAGALAAELLAWHAQPPSAVDVQVQSAEHLARHQPDRVAAGYLRVLAHACQRSDTALAS